MEQHPIEGLMKTAMESIMEMVDVNTVIGDAVETAEGYVIIPISKVACGFGAGGSDFEICGQNSPEDQGDQSLPAFGGGAGAGMSVKPVGFLIASKDQVRLIPVEGNVIYDRLIDLAPQLITQIKNMLEKQSSGQHHITVE